MFPEARSPDAILATAVSARGEVMLRRRGLDGAIELRVNGVFVMDTLETQTERALADLALEAVAEGTRPSYAESARVLVGGLGLGITLSELAGSPLVDELLVAEIEPSLVDWHRRGLVPGTVRLMASSRVRVTTGDVRDVVGSQPPGSFDAIVLDVDNGPAFLVYDANASLYRAGFLARCRDALRPHGALVIWSADEAAELAAALESVFGRVEHHAMPVRLQGRSETYSAYVALLR